MPLMFENFAKILSKVGNIRGIELYIKKLLASLGKAELRTFVGVCCNFGVQGRFAQRAQSAL